jgi:fatty aldehyde-generating acyl-ACP reductase
MQTKAKVGFIGHPPNMDLFRAYIRYLRPDKAYRDELLRKLFEWTPSYKVTSWQNLSLDGKRSLDAVLVMVPFLPEMRDLRLKRIVEKIERAIAICAEEGCTVAALGAFTSIILQGQEADLAARYGLRITSGNTLTAALIVESIEDLARRFRLELAETSMAIIGASGDIGSTCFAYFSDKVKRLWLTARGLTPLREIVRRHAPTTTAEVEITDDNEQAMRQARFVIFVTSAYQHLVTLDQFSPGTVVCDASAPANVAADGALRPDVFAYHGGIARLPFPLDPGFDLGLASPTTFYGCQVEALLLAANPSLPCSWGRGNITADKLRRYRDELASAPTIGVDYSIAGHPYTYQEIEEYASRMASMTSLAS